MRRPPKPLQGKVPAAVIGGIVLAAFLAFGSGWMPFDRPSAPMEMLPKALALRPDVAATVMDATGFGTGDQALDWVAAGRWVASADGRGLDHEWPGLVVTARFRGDAVLVGFDDDTNRFRALVDGEPVAMITRPGQAIVRIGGLAAGDHDLRLERLSEAWTAQRILGLAVPAGGAAMVPEPLPTKVIDVYGDSDSVGYGNVGPGRVCADDTVFLSTDATLAWPALLAARFQASARVTARSGIGLIRNHSGADPGRAMLALWDKALPSDPRATVDAASGPVWLTVVALGDNDFSVPLAADEAWRDQDALLEDFSQSFDRFLRQLMQADPQHPVLVLAFADAGVAAHPAMEKVVRSLAASGQPVSLVQLPKLDRDGCHWHPSQQDHAAIAGLLAGVIEDMLSTGVLEVL
jgi:Carbohydrate esterase 2 N-terminal